MTKTPKWLKGTIIAGSVSCLLLTNMDLAVAENTNQASHPILSFNSTSENSDQKRSSTPKPPTLTPPAPQINVSSYVLMDADTGNIIASQNKDTRLPPASLTKIMTLYLTFQALSNGQIHLNDKVPISVNAWRTSGSRMFVRENTQVPLNLLIQGISVASGNDAAVAVAEYIGGTEQVFAQLMNQAAQKIGMKNTHYTDANGLPSPNHYTTANDLALLTQAIINDFPQYYHYFSEKSFTYNNITQPNRNRLLWHDASVDGLKTGHTAEAKYCLVTSAKRSGMRLISVVMGADSSRAREKNSQALLSYGFRFYQTHRLFAARKPISDTTHKRIWFGKKKYIDFGLKNPLYVTLPTQQMNHLSASIILDKHLEAPIVKGKVYGKIKILMNDQVIMEKPLIALQTSHRSNWFGRILDHISLFLTSKDKSNEK